jgi:hypothetical protein
MSPIVIIGNNKKGVLDFMGKNIHKNFWINKSMRLLKLIIKL